MKIGKCSLRNFASYKTLDFDFSDLGLALLSGDTGSGKSTFMDAVAWVIFGVTGKDGAADDVRPWGENEPTEGEIYVDNLRINRVRAPGKNDLYWIEAGIEFRGKDLTDTQKLLEKRLGVTSDLFLTGAYMSQFTNCDTFFIAKAKDRRAVLEKIADQEFAITLGNKASEARKIDKKEKESTDLELSSIEGRQRALEESINNLKTAIGNWDANQAAKIAKATRDFKSFDATIEREIAAVSLKLEKVADDIIETEEFDVEIEGLTKILRKFKGIRESYNEICTSLTYAKSSIDANDKERASLMKAQNCPSCKRPMDKTERNKRLKELDEQKTPLVRAASDLVEKLASLEASLKEEDSIRERLMVVKEERQENSLKIQAFENLKEKLISLQTAKNPHGELLKSARAEINPFVFELKEAEKIYSIAQTTWQEANVKAAVLENRISLLTWIYDKSFELRALLMNKAVAQIETSTNAHLERFFDAALRVKFVLSDSDKLDVEISNQGYPCSFRALSGGERTMLKLAFSLSLMRAAQDKAGVNFDMIMLDEPFNGLSDSLKIKAFGLLQQLETEYFTVLVIEHSTEMKAQFNRVFCVTKEGIHSEVCELSNQ